MKVNFIKGPMLDGLRQQIYTDFANNKKSTYLTVSTLNTLPRKAAGQ